MSREITNSRRPFAGSVALFSGIAIIVLILLDVTCELPWEMPPTWYLHRTVWGAIALIFCGAGWRWQRSGQAGDAPWRPAVAGRRFHQLIVFSRSDCHLCDDVKAVLANYLEYLPEIREIDIDADAELRSRFDTMVPVVELDGQVRFHGRVDEILLRRLIEATPPIPGT